MGASRIRNTSWNQFIERAKTDVDKRNLDAEEANYKLQIDSQRKLARDAPLARQAAHAV